MPHTALIRVFLAHFPSQSFDFHIATGVSEIAAKRLAHVARKAG
ncbi:hypothetical protein EW026_g5151 [Hermanssonia centrifuga]|uniref:Uncharacterized protein n=1 Tax=Hermanssonia centrifuga TaxID=98765 RepID=A0A4S4KFX1_9APHY|nr:hypothetical protein EW026_g5151 [Hermanssonia centrifuga]